jgi:hypothetical protein
MTTQLPQDARPPETAAHDPELDTMLRQRRASLRSAMGRVENAVAAPVRDDPATWLACVRAEIAVLQEIFAEHLDGTEGPHGYYAGLLAEAPRLAGAVRRLRAEHVRIADAFDAVTALEDRVLADRHAVGPLREASVRLLALLARHRQHGSDLLWEAYGFDVGGES